MQCHATGLSIGDEGAKFPRAVWRSLARVAGAFAQAPIAVLTDHCSNGGDLLLLKTEYPRELIFGWTSEFAVMERVPKKGPGG